MATDYIFFIHGVSTRPKRELSPQLYDRNVNTRPSPKQSSYAEDLIERINQCNQNLKQPLNLKPVPLNWYELMLGAEQQLLNWFKASPNWKNFWFKDFRQKQILPFTGDAALYLSRYIGSEVVNKLKTDALAALKGCNPETDRLHLVTHSWGTVICFDILFASRWDDKGVPGYADAQAIRSQLFGLEPNPNQGIRLTSIHTMGSPIALVNLINVKRLVEEPDSQGKPSFAFDITFGLEQLLKNLRNDRNKHLPWRNFAHPGDPIAYPLATVIPELIDGKKQFLNIEDILVSGSGPLEWLARPVSWSFLALINGGSAHGSYWTNQTVARKILETIQESAKGKS